MMTQKRILCALLAILLTGCSLSPSANLAAELAAAAISTTTAETAIAEYTQAAASPTPLATATHTATATDLPTQIPTPSPTFTKTPSLTPTETPTNTQIPWGIPEDAIIYYLVSLGTGGPVGCGDSLVKVSTGHRRTGDTAADLTVALNAIFATGQYLGGLFNATYPSSLRVADVDLSADGLAIVKLAGSYVKPTTSCDASLYRSQVWGTALQFKEIIRFQPHAGNALLGDRLAIFSDGGK